MDLDKEEEEQRNETIYFWLGETVAELDYVPVGFLQPRVQLRHI